jgi:hypothetical protein
MLVDRSDRDSFSRVIMNKDLEVDLALKCY